MTRDDRASHPAFAADSGGSGGSGDVTWRLLEQAPDGVVVVDETGRILMANHRAEQLFGYDEGALHGHPVELLLAPRWHAEHAVHRARAAATAPRAHAAGDPSSGPRRAVLRLDGLRRDGIEVPVEMTMSPVRSEVGVRVVVVVRQAPPPGDVPTSHPPRRHAEPRDRTAGPAGGEAALDQVVAAGLELQSLARGLPRSAAARLYDVVERLDGAARHLRAETEVPPPETGAAHPSPSPSPGTPLAELVRQVTKALGAEAAMALGAEAAMAAPGRPSDRAPKDPGPTPVGAAVREILAKLASREAPTPATVQITVSQGVRIDVLDGDGRRTEHPAARLLPKRARRPRARVQALDGRVTVEHRTTGGTSTSWSVALPAAGPGVPGEPGPGTASG